MGLVTKGVRMNKQAVFLYSTIQDLGFIYLLFMYVFIYLLFSSKCWLFERVGMWKKWGTDLMAFLSQNLEGRQGCT